LIIAELAQEVKVLISWKIEIIKQFNTGELIMTKSYKKRKKKKQKPRFNKILIFGGLLVAVILLIFLKDQAGKSSTDLDSAVLENNVSSTLEATDVETVEVPEKRFDRLFLENKPIFAFFHSNNCQRCIDMMNVVEEVFPEYEGEVFLVDINVGVMRWWLRVGAYASLLVTDSYPPFSLS